MLELWTLDLMVTLGSFRDLRDIPRRIVITSTSSRTKIYVPVAKWKSFFSESQKNVQLRFAKRKKCLSGLSRVLENDFKLILHWLAPCFHVVSHTLDQSDNPLHTFCTLKYSESRIVLMIVLFWMVGEKCHIQRLGFLFIFLQDNDTHSCVLVEMYLLSNRLLLSKKFCFRV